MPFILTLLLGVALVLLGIYLTGYKLSKPVGRSSYRRGYAVTTSTTRNYRK